MKQNCRKRSWKLLLALSLGLCVAHTGYAMPSGGSVVSGDANISNPGNITLSGTNIINWQQFGIGNGETVSFIGNVGVPFAVLNRVTGNDISNIFGTLNGQGGAVFLVNPNGIVFGNGTSINAASFVASTLSISDTAFTNLINGGNGNFTSNGSTGKISFTGTANFNNSNSTFMGNSIEIDAGVSLTLGAPTAFLAGPNINLTNTPNNGNIDITSYQIKDATADNLINIKGDLTSTNASDISILGGKVAIDGNITSAKDLFIAGGNNYYLKKDDGDFWFDFNAHNVKGNHIEIAQHKILTAASEFALLSNSITNSGTLTSEKNGVKMYIFDDMKTNVDADGKILSATIISTAENKLINNGTIEAKNTGVIDVFSGAIDNTSALKTANGDMILIGANNITIKPDVTGALGSYQISNTTANNTINSSGTIEANGNLAILGGKVDLAGNVTSAGDKFIAAGNDYRFRKDVNGNYGFSFTNRHTSADNTVTIAENTTLTTTGKTGILANSITNNGTLKVGDKLEISALNSMMSDYDANDNLLAGHITSTAGNKFTNHGTIEAGKMEILAGAIDNSGSLKTTTGDMILVSANNITIKPSGSDMMASYAINNATADNTIKSTGTINSKKALALLGGKVDLAGNVKSDSDLFIAAGNKYSLAKNDGDFWFGYNKMNTSAGNTVRIAKGTTVTSAGESAILANSVTNNGVITVNSQHGMAMYVLDNLTSTFDASGKPIAGNISTSKNNKFTNNGTVTIAAGGRFDIMANALDNKGAITTTRGDVVLTGNLSGNAIANTKLQVANDQYTGILMKPDAKGNPTYSFINPVQIQIPEVEKGSSLESAIKQALDILNKLGATPEEKAKATKDIIQGHATAGIESSKESTTTTPVSKANEGSTNTNNLVVADNSTSSNLTVENQEVK